MLDVIKKGEICKILFIDPEMEVGQKLFDMGFVPGTKVKMVRNAPLKDPIKFMVRGYLISMRRNEASRIEVDKINE
jgi:Fe2+ transport system protein FeoA